MLRQSENPSVLIDPRLIRAHETSLIGQVQARLGIYPDLCQFLAILTNLLPAAPRKARILRFLRLGTQFE